MDGMTLGVFWSVVAISMVIGGAIDLQCVFPVGAIAIGLLFVVQLFVLAGRYEAKRPEYERENS